MIKNYIKFAWRDFQSNQTFSFINIFGLAIAFAAVALIAAFIQYETSHDRFFSNSDRVYRLLTEDYRNGERKINPYTYSNLSNYLSTDFPEIESCTRFDSYYQQIDEVSSKSTIMNVKVGIIDSNFFKVFNLTAIKGSLKGVSNANDVVITESSAKRLFPNQNPINQSFQSYIKEDSLANRIVKAVIPDFTNHSHFNVDILMVPKQSAASTQTLDLKRISSSIYLLLKPNTDIQLLTKKLDSFIHQNGAPKSTKLKLLHVQDIHLQASSIGYISTSVQELKYIYMFAISALLILFIACVNYINLNIAKTIPKLKDIGIKKVFGATRQNLYMQLFVEALLYFIVALPVAGIIAYFFWPAFTTLLGIDKQITNLFNWESLLIVFGLSILCVILAVSYPARLINGSNVQELFKQKSSAIKISISPQKILTVFQFGLAVLLTLSSIVMYTQFQLMRNKSMGFDKDYLLIVPDVKSKGKLFKEQLLMNPQIQQVGFASNTNIGYLYAASSMMSLPGDSTKKIGFNFFDHDWQFAQAIGLKLLQGRLLNESDALQLRSVYDEWSKKENQTREASNKLSRQIPILITKSTADKLGIKSLDESIFTDGIQGKIVGIVEDFQLSSFKEESLYSVLRPQIEEHGNAFIRISSKNIPTSLAYIEKTWNMLYPNKAFTYNFADEKIEKMYEKEKQQSTLFFASSSLSILLTAVGLLTLVALMVKQRTKEIGIRKVLGASALSICNLINKDFIKLALLGFVLAAPISFYLMHKWLEDYHLRITLSGWMYALAASIVLLVMLISISMQTIKAAKAKPVDSLREE